MLQRAKDRCKDIMGVVRIDDGLDKEIDSFIKRPENRFRYPSKSAFLNIMINDYLESQKNAQKKR